MCKKGFCERLLCTISITSLVKEIMNFLTLPKSVMFFSHFSGVISTCTTFSTPKSSLTLFQSQFLMILQFDKIYCFSYPVVIYLIEIWPIKSQLIWRCFSIILLCSPHGQRCHPPSLAALQCILWHPAVHNKRLLQ